MDDKITKQKMYTDFSIRLDKLEYKLDKLLNTLEGKTELKRVEIDLNRATNIMMNCQDISPKCVDGTGFCKCADRLLSTEEFDEEMK